MAIPCHIDFPNRLIIGYVPAHATTADVLETVRATAGEPLLTDFNVLTIFEDLNQVVGDLNDFRNALKTVSDALISQYGTRGDFKSAYVVSKNVDFGLLRMFTAYRGRRTHNNDVFYEVTEALDWLGIESSQTRGLLRKVDSLKQQGQDS